MVFLQNNLYVVSALCGLLLSCKTHKVRTEQAPPVEKMAFYTISAVRDSAKQQTRFSVKQVTVANAKLNYHPDVSKAQEPYYLKITISEKGNKTFQVVTEHPLLKRAELYDQDGQIRSKLISLPQGEVTFRTPYFNGYKKITIVEAVQFKELPPVILNNEN